MSATISQVRADNILQLIAHFRLGVSLQYRVLLQLLRMLTAATSVIPLGLLHLRPIQWWNKSLRLNPARHSHRLIVVSHHCIQALRWWNHQEFLISGVPLGVIPYLKEVVMTDASLLGWGGTWNHRVSVANGLQFGPGITSISWSYVQSSLPCIVFYRFWLVAMCSSYQTTPQQCFNWIIKVAQDKVTRISAFHLQDPHMVSLSSSIAKGRSPLGVRKPSSRHSVQ